MVKLPPTLETPMTLEKALALDAQHSATFEALSSDRLNQIHIYFEGGIDYCVVEYADKHGNPAAAFHATCGTAWAFAGLTSDTLTTTFTVKQLLEFGAAMNCLSVEGRAEFGRLLGRPETTIITAGKAQTWVKRLKIKSAHWCDLTLTLSVAGLHIQDNNGSYIIETWAHLGLGGNTRERRLLEFFQMAGEAVPTIECPNRNHASLLRKILISAAGIKESPVHWNAGKATRAFHVGSAYGTDSGGGGEDDDDAIPSMGQHLDYTELETGYSVRTK